MKYAFWSLLFFFIFGFNQAQGLTCQKVLSAPQINAQNLKLQIIAGSDVAPQLIDQLQILIQRAAELYENHFPNVNETLVIQIGSASQALRTGYDFKENKLNFPAIEGVQNFGLHSADVIQHELFHFLTCRNFPSLCVPQLLKSKEALVLHEALADYFSYQLNPDHSFGDGYFSDGRTLRTYKNDLLLSQTEGPHAQGNALTKYLIQNKISLDQVADFLGKQNFFIEDLININPTMKAQILADTQMRLIEQVSNYSPSSLNRYRISSSQPLLLQFKPNTDLTNYALQLEIAWVTEAGQKPNFFQITSTSRDKSSLSFEISPLTSARPEKLIALLLSEGKILGSRTYYFGPALPKTPQ